MLKKQGNMHSATIDESGFGGKGKQFVLFDEHIDWLKNRSKRDKKKMSAILRELIDKEMAQEAQPANS